MNSWVCAAGLHRNGSRRSRRRQSIFQRAPRGQRCSRVQARLLNALEGLFPSGAIRLPFVPTKSWMKVKKPKSRANDEMTWLDLIKAAPQALSDGNLACGIIVGIRRRGP